MELNLDRWKIRFHRSEQPAVAICILLAAVGIGGYFSVKRATSGRLFDMDQMLAAPAFYQVDLNSAEWPEFVVLPGIGEKLAQAMVAYREQHGPFRRVEDVLDVSGIGDAKFGAIRPHLLPLSHSN